MTLERDYIASVGKNVVFAEVTVCDNPGGFRLLGDLVMMVVKKPYLVCGEEMSHPFSFNMASSLSESPTAFCFLNLAAQSLSYCLMSEADADNLTVPGVCVSNPFEQTFYPLDVLIDPVVASRNQVKLVSAYSLWKFVVEGVIDPELETAVD